VEGIVERSSGGDRRLKAMLLTAKQKNLVSLPASYLIQPENLAAAVAVDTDRDDDGNRDNVAGLAHFGV
jgi:hypothetical protein